MIVRGTVLRARLDPTVGREQRGDRPCVVVSDPAVASSQRFPLLVVVPLTGTSAPGPLYPVMSPGPSGLAKPSFALVDQIRAIDKRRIQKVYGRVSDTEMSQIDSALRFLLELP